MDGVGRAAYACTHAWPDNTCMPHALQVNVFTCALVPEFELEFLALVAVVGLPATTNANAAAAASSLASGRAPRVCARGGVTRHIFVCFVSARE